MITTLFLVLGGPACGKSTLCKTILSRHDMIHISVGELLMLEIEKNTELGKTIYQYIQNSIIVPAKITFDIMIAEISKYPGKTILLDGYPRNQENNEYFKKNIPSSIILKKVLFLKCDDDLMIRRVTQRNQNNDKIRFDDDINVIKKRIHVFNTQTMIVVNEYNEKKQVVTLDCMQSPNDMVDSIEQLFMI